MDDCADESWFVHMPNHVKHRSSEQHATKESSRSSPFRISVDEFWFQSTTNATLSISLKCYFDLPYVLFSLHFVIQELPNFCRDLVSFFQKFVKLICYWANGNGYWWLEIVYRNLGNFFTELREIIAEICRYWYCSRACNFVSNQPSDHRNARFSLSLRLWRQLRKHWERATEYNRRGSHSGAPITTRRKI